MSQTFSVENWRPVVGYEGIYEVSDRGAVRSVPRLDRLGRLNQGRDLRPGRRASGHLLVSLWRDGRGRTIEVQRVVGEAFIGPLPRGMETRHLDGDPANNAAANLQYGTKSENNLDRVRHGVHHNSRKTTCPRGHRLEAPNLRIAAAASGHRQCRACGREASRAHHAGEPFDSARAAAAYAQIMQEA